jgi:serine/threonine protein kinase
MLLDLPYNASIDWWQLGIITYQMVTWQSPFRGENEDEIYDSILADEPSLPTYMTEDTTDFVQKLLDKDPERRLGSGKDGPDEVMAHPFFSEVEWNDLYHKRVPAPFIPVVANRIDVSNFGSDYTLVDTFMNFDTPECMIFSFRILTWIITDTES